MLGWRGRRRPGDVERCSFIVLLLSCAQGYPKRDSSLGGGGGGADGAEVEWRLSIECTQAVGLASPKWGWPGERSQCCQDSDNDQS